MVKKKLKIMQFVNAKTQFEYAKTQKTVQVVAWTCLDRRTKKALNDYLLQVLPRLLLSSHSSTYSVASS